MKKILKKLLPSYRARDYIVEKIKNIENRMSRLSQQITDLDKKNEYLFWLLQKKEDETIEQTKKRVFLEMPRATGVLREVQLVENFLLIRLKEICDKNNFMLCLCGGTMLGAVRHHGFIPWDDDIDVFMMREDAFKLIDILKDDEQISCHCYHAKTGHHVLKIKYRFNDTIFIDIFTYDRIDCMPENKEQRWMETQETAHQYEMRMRDIIGTWGGVSLQFDGFFVHSSELDEIAKKEFDKVTAHLDYYGHGNSLCCSMFDGTFYRSAFGVGIFSIDDMLPLAKNKVEFEGNRYDVFMNFDTLLELEYGNIWQMPTKVYPSHLDELRDLDKAIKTIRLKLDGGDCVAEN